MTSDLEAFPSLLPASSLVMHNHTLQKIEHKGLAFFILLCIVVLTNLLGLLGNIMLITVMHKSRSTDFNQSYRLYLIGLAFTDSLNICTRLTDSLEEFLDYKYGKYMLHQSSWSCRIYDFIDGVFTIASAWLIVCISCERFLMMYFPLKGRMWWISHYVIIFISVFLTAIATQTPRLYFMERDAKEGFCRFKLEDTTFLIAVSFDSFVRFFCVYGIPGFTVLILNFLIILRMRRATLRQDIHQRYTAKHSCSVTASSNSNTSNNNNISSIISSNNNNNNNNNSSNVSSQGIYSLPADEMRTIGERTRRDRKRAAWILVTISCTYIVCMAPESIATFYWSIILHYYDPALVPKQLDDAYIKYLYLYRFVYQIFTAISYGSNFFTYVAFGKRFRKEVSSVFGFTSTSSNLDPNQQHAFHPENVPLRKYPVYGWHGRPVVDYLHPQQSPTDSNYGEWSPPRV